MLITTPNVYDRISGWGWSTLLPVTPHVFCACLEYFSWNRITFLQILLKIFGLGPKEKDYLCNFGKGQKVGGAWVPRLIASVSSGLTLCHLRIWQTWFDLHKDLLSFIAKGCGEALLYSCFTEVFHGHFAYVMLALWECTSTLFWRLPHASHPLCLDFQDDSDLGQGGKQLWRGIYRSLDIGPGLEQPHIRTQVQGGQRGSP